MSQRLRFFVRPGVVLLLVLLSLPLTAWAQATPEPDQLPNQLSPIYVTTRIFQLVGKPGSAKNLSDQVFRLKTANLADEEKWLAAFRKVYPEVEPALLLTNSQRIFRTSKPGTISFAQAGTSTLQVILNGAQSTGDGVTPGTSLLADVGQHFGNDRTNPPLTMAMQMVEIENAMTYFFAAPRAQFTGPQYAVFFRPNAPVKSFDNSEVVLLFAFSVDLTRPVPAARQFNEQQSAALINEAPKKVQPELNAALKQAGLSGKVQVRVEIAPDGKVIRALTQNSTLPEMNQEVIAAARQWQFASTLFAENKEPISGLLTFEFAAPPKPAEPPKQSSSN